MKDLTQATEHLSTLQEQLKLNHMFLQRNILYTQGGGPYDIEYLVVGGGGAGATRHSSDDYYMGGGGAGGFRTGTLTLTPGVVYSIDVGAGGSRYNSGSTYGKGNDGENSSISGSGITTVTAAGGGTAGTLNHPSATPSYNASTQAPSKGNHGGSGGGAAGWDGQYQAGTKGNGNTPSTSPSQGNDGGAVTGMTNGSNFAGAGGGGAGGAGGGVSAAGNSGGNGGAAKISNITGTNVYYAGGGHGGQGYSGGSTGAGSNGTGYTGNDNTGDGGNPGLNTDATANGNSGVIILKIPEANWSNTTVGSPGVSDITGYKIVKYTGDGSYTG